MKCPECRWHASGFQLEERKNLAERYIEEDKGHEEQDRMVLNMVLEEVEKLDRIDSERKAAEYENLSKYTFGRYMKFNISFLFLPYVILIVSLLFGGPGDISPLLDNPIWIVLGCAAMSALFIAVNTLLYIMARTKLFFLKRSK